MPSFLSFSGQAKDFRTSRKPLPYFDSLQKSRFTFVNVLALPLILCPLSHSLSLCLKMSHLYLMHTCREWNFPWLMLITFVLTIILCAGNWSFHLSQKPKHSWAIFPDFQENKPCFPVKGNGLLSSVSGCATGWGRPSSHERMCLTFKGVACKCRWL